MFSPCIRSLRCLKIATRTMLLSLRFSYLATVNYIRVSLPTVIRFYDAQFRQKFFKEIVFYAIPNFRRTHGNMLNIYLKKNRCNIFNIRIVKLLCFDCANLHIIISIGRVRVAETWNKNGFVASHLGRLSDLFRNFVFDRLTTSIVESMTFVKIYHFGSARLRYRWRTNRSAIRIFDYDDIGTL